MASQRALVVGYGSIGSRHVRLLEDMGLDVGVVSRRAVPVRRRFDRIEPALAEFAPDYVVIADETARHADTLRAVTQCGWQGPVLVEKPLVSRAEEFTRDLHACRPVVAYNLRLHPVLLELKQRIAGQTLLTLEVRAASPLPNWRSGRDYRMTSSARATMGGGVLRDLSHELDYVLWLCGDWRRVTAMAGHLSPLETDTEDAALVLIETEHCPQVSASLNYFEQTTDRWIVVNTNTTTYRADFAAGTLSVNGGIELAVTDTGLDATYRRQHERMLSDERDGLCGMEEGLAVVELIDAIESSAGRQQWITKTPGGQTEAIGSVR